MKKNQSSQNTSANGFKFLLTKIKDLPDDLTCGTILRPNWPELCRCLLTKFPTSSRNLSFCSRKLINLMDFSLKLAKKAQFELKMAQISLILAKIAANQLICTRICPKSTCICLNFAHLCSIQGAIALKCSCGRRIGREKDFT